SAIKKKASRLLKSITRKLYDDEARVFIESLPKQTQEIIGAVTPYTMTSPQRLAGLCDAVTYIEERGIPGDVVECGVWRGGSSMAIALSLLARNSTERSLYLYDTYEGMSEPTEHDKEIVSQARAADLLASSSKDSGVWAYAALDEV